MQNKIKAIICSLACCLVGTANATLIHFDGDIKYHNDIISTEFTILNDATDIRLWTDSYDNGVNFDPVTALWDSSGTLLFENDDDDTINPLTQTKYDSGFLLNSLTAGVYTFTVATYDNLALGTSLSDGFDFSSELPIELSVWDQPSNGIDMGTYWSVWIDGADSAVNNNAVDIPEPSTMPLFAFGLMLLARLRRKSA